MVFGSIPRTEKPWMATICAWPMLFLPPWLQEGGKPDTSGNAVSSHWWHACCGGHKVHNLCGCWKCPEQLCFARKNTLSFFLPIECQTMPPSHCDFLFFIVLNRVAQLQSPRDATSSFSAKANLLVEELIWLNTYADNVFAFSTHLQSWRNTLTKVWL